MKWKVCYWVYLAIVVLFILINIKTKEGLVEKSQSQSDCRELGKTECSASNTCIWKTDNTCELAHSSDLTPSSEPVPSNSDQSIDRSGEPSSNTNTSNYGLSN